MIAAHDFYENEFAQFWIANGILFFEYKPNTILDLEAAQHIVADRIHFQNEKSYPVLCDVRGIVNTDKSGRDYLAQSGSVLTKAVALIVNQQVSLTISNFYLRISKPSVPTQLFNNKEDALAFLEQFI
ncbi:MAG: hypothetical protein PHC28_16565 [Flavobacterium sp.]|uniref:DUF7793 family protein n=1 Tax=Flavobacterium sp. TaxID=239 RepID=UPI00261230E1|nr:hypothetical protein [Flavobacterium sp.]MDD5152066.1 hypothetical protein [Flavobacterium sp.]